MTLDQGLAAVLAAVLVLASSEWGRWRQRRADDKRSELEWTHQVALNEERARQESTARHEQWQREDQLAREARFREAELRRIAATRMHCLQSLDQAIEGVFATGPRPITMVEWSLAKHPDADLSLLGTPEAMALYGRSTLVLMNAHGSKTVTPAVHLAYTDGTAGVLKALRIQEDIVNAGAPALRCPQIQISDLHLEKLNDPLLLVLLAQGLGGSALPTATGTPPQAGKGGA
jgi:hypothetical protein